MEERLSIDGRCLSRQRRPLEADRDSSCAAASGDERAIAGLYDRYGSVLYAVAYRIVGQRADAEEVVLDAFAQAWREAPRFEAGRGSVAGWLTMIARSRALDLVRARSSARPDHRVRRRRAAATRRRRWASSGPIRSKALDHDERRHQVQAGAADRCRPPQRQAIELAYLRGAVAVGDRRAAPESRSAR